jgi:cytochrome P450
VQPENSPLSQIAGARLHAVLRQFRTDEPVRPVPLPDGARVWLITRYAEARQALADPRLSKRIARGITSGNRAGGPMSHHMLSSDPPDHTRLRRIVSAGFTARRVERLEPRIAQITDGLLDAMAGHDEVDLIDAFAFPLPIQVICELLRVPSDDQASFRSWSNTIVSGGLGEDQSRVTELGEVLGQLVAYITRLLADKRRAPADDLLSALLGRGEGGRGEGGREEADRLTEDELISMVFLMLIAGHETTVNLIGSGTYLLLTHPDQRDRLVADPALLPKAVEEFLRFEPPVQTSTFRIAAEPVEYAGVTIPAGEPVLISLLSANRDDSVFTDADRFDMARRDAGHLAFGHGIHFCLGAALARLEGRIAIGTLLQRFPRLRLAVDPDELAWRPGLLIRGLVRLPVRLR